MRIHDSIKRFNEGVNKVLSPAETYRKAYEIISNMHPSILDTFYQVKRPSGIPQFTFIGSQRYLDATSSCCSFGKGHTRDQALASGIMELVERYSCYGFLDDKDRSTIASFKTMLNDANLFQKSDFLSTFLSNAPEQVPFSKEIMDTRIRWYEGYTISGEKLYLPAGLSHHFLHGSNGMASGNSFEEALLQGVCEVIERHCKTLVFNDRRGTPLIDISTIDHPEARKLISKFRALGQEVLVRDFSFGMGVPVVGVIRPVDDKHCYITAGAATSRYEALIRALTENSQMEHEKSKLLINKNRQLFRTAEVLRMKDMPHIKNKNIKIELENLEEILSRQNMKIFFHDARDKELGIPAVISFVTRCSHNYRKPSMTNFLIAILQDHMDSQRYDEALYCVNKFKSIDKTNPAVYEYFRGSVQLCNHKFQEAIQSYKSVFAKIRADRVKVACLINCGICYQAMGKKNEALDCFMKAREKSPAFQFEVINFYRSIMRSQNEQLKETIVQAKALYENVLWKKKVDNTLYVFTAGEVNKIAVSESEIVDYLKITGKYQPMMREVIKRSGTKEEAKRRGVTITERELRSAIDAFRILNNLGKASDMESWLKLNGTSWEAFEEYLETELIISKFKDYLEKKTGKATCLSLLAVKKHIREMAYKDWLKKQLE